MTRWGCGRGALLGQDRHGRRQRGDTQSKQRWSHDKILLPELHDAAGARANSRRDPVGDRTRLRDRLEPLDRGEQIHPALREHRLEGARQGLRKGFEPRRLGLALGRERDQAAALILGIGLGADQALAGKRIGKADDQRVAEPEPEGDFGDPHRTVSAEQQQGRAGARRRGAAEIAQGLGGAFEDQLRCAAQAVRQKGKPKRADEIFGHDPYLVTLPVTE